MSWFTDTRDAITGKLQNQITEAVKDPVPTTANVNGAAPSGFSAVTSSPYFPLMVVGGILLLVFMFRKG